MTPPLSLKTISPVMFITVAITVLCKWSVVDVDADDDDHDLSDNDDRDLFDDDNDSFQLFDPHKRHSE